MRSTSTAMPRLTPPGSITVGLPSRSSKARPITGHSWAALTIAQAIRWVKLTFIPRSLRTSLSALRLASSVSTASSRNEVAVGIERLSFIALARVAAGPRRGFASPATTVPTGTAPSPSLERTSDLVILPPGPLPLTPLRSTPLASAARRATGVALAPSVADGSATLGEVSAVPAPSPSAPSPLTISASGLPISIVSSGPTRILVIVPLAGAGTSASTLSVETSTTVSPSAIWSPSVTCHSSTVPSVTDSPISGITISSPPPSRDLPADTEASSVVAFSSLAAGASVLAPAPLESSAGSSSPGSSVCSCCSTAAGAPPPLGSMSASGLPTSTSSSTWT